MNKKISRFAGGISIFLFVLVLLFSTADTNLMGAFLNPMLFTFFGSTEEALVPKMSVISSVTVFLSSVSMVVAGVFADRTSRKWICFTGTMAYAISSIITIFTPDGELGYTFFFIVRSLNGIGIGAITPTIFSMVGDVAQPTRRTRAFAYINIAIAMGQLVGMMMGGMMQETWRTAYGIIGGIGLVLGILIIFMSEPKRGAVETELQGVEGAEYAFKFKFSDFKKMWTNKSNFWLITNFVDCIPSGIIFFLIFKYLEDEKNMAPENTTIVVLLAFVGGFFGAFIFGLIGDKWFIKNKRAKVILALFCNGFPVLFFIVFLLTPFYIPDGATLGETFGTPGVAVAVGSLVLLMAINQGVGPNWHSTLTDVNLPEHRSTMISLASFMDLIGHTVGPLIAGFMAAQFSLQGAMWAATGFWVLNIGLWFPVFAYLPGDLKKVHDTLEERAEAMKMSKE